MKFSIFGLHSIVFACLVLCGCGHSFTARSATSNNSGLGPQLADVQIGDQNGREIPDQFMGLSHEWGDAQAMMGSTSSGGNFAYRNLLRNLTSYGSGPIVIRIGGNSTDTSRTPLPGALNAFADISRTIGAQFILGVNLGTNDASLAARQAQGYVKAMPAGSIAAIEIGNEPDLYARQHLRDGVYNFQRYLTEFDTWRRAITTAVGPRMRFFGPSWGDLSSLQDTGKFLDAEHAYLYAFSFHYYVGYVSPAHSNRANLLLSPKASAEASTRVAAAVAAAHSQNVPFRMGELNSIAGGGQDGVSNSFEAGLWAIDIMFEYANVGVDGVNWHTVSHDTYSPFTFSKTFGLLNVYQIRQVTPLYYGMLFFQAATGHHSHLRAVQAHTQLNMKFWATQDEGGDLRLVAINKDPQSGYIKVTQPGFHKIVVDRLVAPSFEAKTGVTFDGQTFDGSSDGLLRGAKHLDQYFPQDGVFEIPISGTSAMIVKFVR